METGDHGARLTGAMLTEDYLHAGESGEFNSNWYITVYLPLKDLPRLAPDLTTD